MVSLEPDIRVGDDRADSFGKLSLWCGRGTCGKQLGTSYGSAPSFDPIKQPKIWEEKCVISKQFLSTLKSTHLEIAEVEKCCFKGLGNVLMSLPVMLARRSPDLGMPLPGEAKFCGALEKYLHSVAGKARESPRRVPLFQPLPTSPYFLLLKTPNVGRVSLAHHQPPVDSI